LERLNDTVDWEVFRPDLERIDQKVRKSAAGCKPTCRVLMFKLLILQRLYGLSDERLEYQVRDRLSFMRFLGLDLEGKIPDARTVWAFREALKTHQLADVLFERLNRTLAGMGIRMKSGQIIDASFVSVPVQRNTREENIVIKDGAVPLEWGKTPNKLAHKDVDARWTKKGGQRYYGYKNHVNMDRDMKLVAAQACTDASVHDSQMLEAVLRRPEAGGEGVWADSAYRSEAREQRLAEGGHRSQIHERAYRDAPLGDEQRARNTAKSRVRARVEHVFGQMENGMGGMCLRSVGLARAKVGVALMNLAYNLRRIEWLIRSKVFPFTRVTAPVCGTA